MQHPHARIPAAALAALTLLALKPGPGPAGTPAAWHPAHEVTLTLPGEPGRPFVLDGRVVGAADSVPLRGVHVHFYHADAHGHYSEKRDEPPRLAGDLVSGAHGEYRVRTVLPGMYDGMPHVHIAVIDGNGISTFLILTLCRLHGPGSDSVYATLPNYPRLPASDHQLHFANVEPADGGGFVCHWDLPAPSTAGTPAR